MDEYNIEGIKITIEEKEKILMKVEMLMNEYELILLKEKSLSESLDKLIINAIYQIYSPKEFCKFLLKIDRLKPMDAEKLQIFITEFFDRAFSKYKYMVFYDGKKYISVKTNEIYDISIDGFFGVDDFIEIIDKDESIIGISSLSKIEFFEDEESAKLFCECKDS